MADPSTTNYGWVKPTVGSDADTWGGLINADLDGIDTVVGNIASIIAIAGTEIINLSGSLTGVSSSLGGVSSSLTGVSSALSAITVSTAGISSSLSTTNAAQASLSSSLANVSSSLTGISTSLGSAVSGTAAADIGFLGLPPNPQNGAYTLQPSDAGGSIYSNNSGSQTITVAPNSSEAIAALSAILIINDGSGSITIAAGSGVQLILAGAGTSGTRHVAVKGMATLIQVATDRWFVSGPGVT